MKKRVVVLVHANSRPRHRGLYFLSQLTVLWKKQGIDVKVMLGPARPVAGDVLFMHVDLSRVPDEYLAAAAHFPVSVNACVRDIRKSAISRNLVGRGSDWAGPVIVKTLLNCAGLGEKRYARGRGPDRPLNLKTPDQYPIYPRLAQVPDRVFDHPGLVVEKFLPERSGEYYCLRSYNFLGDAEDCFLAYSDRPVVNLASIKRMEPVEVHPEIRARREELGFDYGKFDYVVHDGRAVLLDANKTPGVFPIRDKSQMDMMRRRAAGIRRFLEA